MSGRILDASDVLLAFVPMAFVLVVTTVSDRYQDHPLDTLGYAWLVTAALPLLLARRYPLPVFLAVALLTWSYYGWGHAEGPVAVLPTIALFTLARLRGPVVAGLAGASTLLASLLVYLALGGAVTFEARAALPVVWLAAVVGIGTAARNRAAALQAASEQANERRHRLAERERLRIAREVHDVVAHSLAMINVQAGVAAHVADRRPEQAVEALRAIKEASATALADLRATVAVLRTGQGLGPAPSLRQLDGLLERTRATGREVRVHGSPGELPAPVDVAAYRILQESLTNVVRHAHQATVVEIHFGRNGQVLELVVRDNGRNPNGATGGPTTGLNTAPLAVPVAATTAELMAVPTAGHGLRGMYERAAALGGRLDARIVDDGFEVRAELPLREDE